MNKLNYLTNCVCSDGDSINQMKEHSYQISERTFFKYVDRKEVENLLGYDKNFRISSDWHVRYNKGKFEGKNVYFLIHSAIEYIFG